MSDSEEKTRKLTYRPDENCEGSCRHAPAIELGLRPGSIVIVSGRHTAATQASAMPVTGGSGMSAAVLTGGEYGTGTNGRPAADALVPTQNTATAVAQQQTAPMLSGSFKGTLILFVMG